MMASINPNPEEPARPALRYHGAKWRLAPWIASHFPPKAAVDVYEEAFCGSASVLMRIDRSPIEIINDRDGDVVNFFRVLRERPEELIRQIELTPFARSEWEMAGESTDDPVERARRFYLRSYGSISGPTAQWRSGWRRQKRLSRKADGTGAMSSAARVFADVGHLHTVAARLRGGIHRGRGCAEDYSGLRRGADAALCGPALPGRDAEVMEIDGISARDDG